MRRTGWPAPDGAEGRRGRLCIRSTAIGSRAGQASSQSRLVQRRHRECRRPPSPVRRSVQIEIAIASIAERQDRTRAAPARSAPATANDPAAPVQAGACRGVALSVVASASSLTRCLSRRPPMRYFTSAKTATARGIAIERGVPSDAAPSSSGNRCRFSRRAATGRAYRSRSCRRAPVDTRARVCARSAQPGPERSRACAGTRNLSSRSSDANSRRRTEDTSAGATLSMNNR